MTFEELTALSDKLNNILSPAMKECIELLQPHLLSPSEKGDGTQAMRTYLSVFLSEYFFPASEMPPGMKEPMMRMLVEDILAVTNNCVQEIIK